MIAMISCFHKPAEKPQDKEYFGILVVVGNEPFTSFALDDGLGHITVLKNDKKMEAKLNDLQGKKIRVFGISLDGEQAVQIKSIELYKDKLE